MRIRTTVLILTLVLLSVSCQEQQPEPQQEQQQQQTQAVVPPAGQLPAEVVKTAETPIPAESQAKAEEKKPEAKAVEEKPLTPEELKAADVPEPNLEPITVPKFAYPDFTGKKVAILHSANVLGETRPCG